MVTAVHSFDPEKNLVKVFGLQTHFCTLTGLTVFQHIKKHFYMVKLTCSPCFMYNYFSKKITAFLFTPAVCFCLILMNLNVCVNESSFSPLIIEVLSFCPFIKLSLVIHNYDASLQSLFCSKSFFCSSSS